ncbi:hypothetical protein [Paenibacillus polymyxa]
MAKLTAQQKILAVKRYLEGKERQGSVAKSIGLNTSNVDSAVSISW